MDYPLIVENLKKTYEGKGNVVQALKGISFKVKKGEIFGLLGPNGAGKTTTTNILTGILTADSGTVLFFGEKESERTKNKVNVANGYGSLTGGLTVFQNLKVFAKIYNVKNPEQKIDSLLQRFHAFDLKNRKVFTLSSGQKARVNVCKSLINDPELLFLDEATIGLDPHIASEIRREIKNLNTTIVFTSHMMQEVEELCDRIAFLSKGQILKIDTPKGIKKLINEHTFVIELTKKPKNAESIFKNINAKKITEDRIAIELKSQKEIHKIIHTLIMKGFEIKDLHIKRTTLDEVFIKIAKGEL
ncbi:MAG TPA: ABC transporter ATP-binding protein [Candidatus Nanoarchaeia archaeon]|nr:ABC transporter ATP-binding protein [Candidatus Nanoarchaeia archaeon]